MSSRLVVPANITIIALPPKCFELNPVQNVWQFMRDNWLSTRSVSVETSNSMSLSAQQTVYFFNNSISA